MYLGFWEVDRFQETGPGQMKDAYSLTADASGNVLVSDTGEEFNELDNVQSCARMIARAQPGIGRDFEDSKSIHVGVETGPIAATR